MFLFLLCFVLVLVVIWFGFQKFMKRNHNYWQKRNVPFFDTTKLFSFWEGITFKYALQDTETIVYNAVKKAGITTCTGVIEFGNPSFYVVDPDLIKAILVKDFDSFVDRRSFGTDEKDLFNKMLVSAKGQDWKDLRSTMSPTFTTGKIRRMYSIFNDSSNKLANFLQTEIGQNGNELELRNAFGRYTMDVIASAAFGLNPDSFATTQTEFAKYALIFQNQFAGLNALKFLVIFFSPKLFSLLGLSFMNRDATKFFSKVINDTIKHREITGEKRQDFLQLMMDARNSSGDNIDLEDNLEKEAPLTGTHKKMELTEDYVLAQSLIFFLGGFDTVETLLLMAGYELALNPVSQDTLYEELSIASSTNGGELSYDVVMQLDYLDQVVSETLRKWPAGIRLERKCTKQYQVPNSDITLEPDTLAVIPVYAIHHDEKHYPQPEKFLPERFTAENKANRNPYTYMPFGLGPRNCIAMRFALAEGKAAIAHLILHFKLEPSTKTQIPLKFKAMSAFKPANGLWLKVTPRN